MITSSIIPLFIFTTLTLTTNVVFLLATCNNSTQLVPHGRGLQQVGRRPPLRGFVSVHIQSAYFVIQRFKKKVTIDPKNITRTWVGPDVCGKYKGFYCATLIRDNKTTIAGVLFNGYNFDGPNLTLDGFLDGFPDLNYFHANSNMFKGQVPATLGKIGYLFELDLSNNRLTCTFPYQVLAARQLTFLDIRFNTFAGAVPDQVFGLALDVLFMNNNGFFQRIPETIGDTPALYITLANNLFTGPIPRSIGRVGKTLLEILLLNNRLTGCLPLQIGYLQRATLFDASRNVLTGPIPVSFSCLKKMEILNLAHNELYGRVPEVVCTLPNLYRLTLSRNYFTQVGPACRRLIAKGVLDVRMNCIAGQPGQRTAAECAAFFRRAKRCSDARWFNWIPCNGKSVHRHLLELPSTTASTPASGGPRLYKTLNPDQM